MINAKFVTCELCQSYYADPRQIPCAHSFCFDCISGRFNEEALTLICPKCDKLHRYNSINEFHNRCMRDGFLASMVTQFKKSQSRSSAPPPGFSSRPSSSIPTNFSTQTFTSIPPTGTQEVKSTNNEQSDSERSSSTVKDFQRPSSVSSQTGTPKLFAKCQSCLIKGELIVCSHCDNVVCQKCFDEHLSVINGDVQREWNSCKTKFESINERSIRFVHDEEEMNAKARQLQTYVTKQSEKLIETVELHKKTYIDIIEKHRQTYKQSFPHEQVVDEYESIDKRVADLLKSNDITSDKINDFLFEIEHLEGRLDSLNKLLDSNDLKFPVLTLPESIDTSAFYGTIEFVSSNNDSHLSATSNGHPDTNPKFDKENKRPNGPFINPNNKFPPKRIELNLSLSNLNVPKKKLLWQIDYFSVPYYVRTYENQLFVCDRYGSLAIYKLNKSNDLRQKPSLIRDVKLFKDNFSSTLTTDEDQTIIDSFVVYKLWIIVFRRKKNELHGTIYLFTHEGKSIANGKYAHNHPSRELTIDTEKNLLWSLDQKHLCLFCYDLPDTKSNNPEEYFRNGRPHVQFSKPFAPIHISVNQYVLAVLDKNRQAVHVYDKETRHELYEYIWNNENSTHVCWDMALFCDNSLLIKLDETSSLKSGPSKHIYLQLDDTKQDNVVGMIEETDAYGMMIASTDEVLIGIRINTKGVIKCYI